MRLRIEARASELGALIGWDSVIIASVVTNSFLIRTNIVKNSTF
jgi:hypothetical protein